MMTWYRCALLLFVVLYFISLLSILYSLDAGRVMGVIYYSTLLIKIHV